MSSSTALIIASVVSRATPARVAGAASQAATSSCVGARLRDDAPRRRRASPRLERRERPVEARREAPARAVAGRRRRRQRGRWPSCAPIEASSPALDRLGERVELGAPRPARAPLRRATRVARHRPPALGRATIARPRRPASARDPRRRSALRRTPSRPHRGRARGGAQRVEARRAATRPARGRGARRRSRRPGRPARGPNTSRTRHMATQHGGERRGCLSCADGLRRRAARPAQGRAAPAPRRVGPPGDRCGAGRGDRHAARPREARRRMVGPVRCAEPGRAARLLRPAHRAAPDARGRSSASTAELVEDLAARRRHVRRDPVGPPAPPRRAACPSPPSSRRVVAGVEPRSARSGGPLVGLIVTAMRSAPARGQRGAGPGRGRVRAAGRRLRPRRARGRSGRHRRMPRPSVRPRTAGWPSPPTPERWRARIACGRCSTSASGASRTARPPSGRGRRWRSCASADVTLDLCPTSNVQAGLVADLSDHPVAALHRAGVSVTLSTDDRTVTGTTLSDELARTAYGRRPRRPTSWRPSRSTASAARSRLRRPSGR